MEGSRPIVLSVAGLDPSAGAGLLADIKTLEEHRVYGLGICTAVTIQTGNEFVSIRWEEETEILNALKLMLDKYEIKAVKIGIVEHIDRLKNIISTIHTKDRAIKMVWDPVIRSSSGFDFWTGGVNEGLLKEILRMVHLITPNYNEAAGLLPTLNPKLAARELSAYCKVLLKGGHNESEPGVDYLYAKGEELRLNPGSTDVKAKHGSGCVLSSAIAANLAIGHDLHSSCVIAKRYTERFLLSNQTLLGYHHV